MKTSHWSKVSLAVAVFFIGFALFPPVDWRSVIILFIGALNLRDWWKYRIVSRR